MHRCFSGTLASLLALLCLGDAAIAGRRVSEEALVFRNLRGGVCTVYGDGQGSGFLVDSLGIILTNDHVVGNASRIRVKFDDSTRVEAILIASDDKKDIAALFVNPSVVAGYPILPLAVASDSMVFEGERVIAIGSPLNQEKIMTTGIVSKVEATALITDVNINHGNSGGPLLNVDGEVIGINTFLDAGTPNGPGISGSVKITEVTELLDQARAALGSTMAPSERRLPMASQVPFPIDSLRVVAESENFKRGPYEVSSQVATGQFTVIVVTPVYDAWRNWRTEVQLAKATKRREQKGGTEASRQYDPVRQMREWMRYTDESYAPVVTIQISPKVGQTLGSIFGNILGAAATGAAGGSTYRGSYHYEYKADFLRVEMTRDSVSIDDLNCFRTMIPAVFATANWDGDHSIEDQARTGILQCDPTVFSPRDSTASEVIADERPLNTWKRLNSQRDTYAFPTVHVRIWSVEKPEVPYEFDLPRATVKRVWADFAAWRAAAAASVAVE